MGPGDAEDGREMTDDELVLSRLELRGEVLYLVPEGRPASLRKNEKGYWRVSIPLGSRGKKRTFRQARVKFRLAHGRWPDPEVDHRDRDRGNDLLSNLVEATRVENMQNRNPPRQRSLPRGVYKPKRGAGFVAAVTWNKVRHNLGYHPTPEAAYAAAQAFRAKHCGEHT